MIAEHPKYYRNEKDAKARLVAAREEFPPGSEVTTKSGSTVRIKDWFRVKPGPGGMGVLQASVLAEMLDEGYHGDIWVNVNALQVASTD